MWITVGVPFSDCKDKENTVSNYLVVQLTKKKDKQTKQKQTKWELKNISCVQNLKTDSKIICEN